VVQLVQADEPEVVLGGKRRVLGLTDGFTRRSSREGLEATVREEASKDAHVQVDLLSQVGRQPSQDGAGRGLVARGHENVDVAIGTEAGSGIEARQRPALEDNWEQPRFIEMRKDVLKGLLVANRFERMEPVRLA
jgi:hypothetical protein